MERIVQIEIPVSDLHHAERFYKAVFGWERTPTDMHNYYLLDVPKSAGYGVALVGNHQAKSPSASVTIYMQCDDVEKTLAAVTANGGKVLFGPKKIPPYGIIHQIADPDGNRWGLFKEI